MRKLPGENVTIVKNKEEKTINVQSDKSDFQLLLMNEDDYPKFPEFNADKQIVLEDEKSRNLLKKLFCLLYRRSKTFVHRYFSGTPGW